MRFLFAALALLVAWPVCAAPIDIASSVTAGGTLSLSTDDGYLSSEVTANSAFTLDCNGKTLAISGSGKINANADLEIRECVITWTTTNFWTSANWPPANWNNGFNPNRAIIKATSGTLKFHHNTVTASVPAGHPGTYPGAAFFPPSAFLLDVQGGNAEVEDNTFTSAYSYAVGFVNGFNFGTVDIERNFVQYAHFPIRMRTGTTVNIIDQKHDHSSFGGAYILDVTTLNVYRPTFLYTGTTGSGDHFQLRGVDNAIIEGGFLDHAGCYGISVFSDATFQGGNLTIRGTGIYSNYTVATYFQGTAAYPLGDIKLDRVDIAYGTSGALYSEYVSNLVVEYTVFTDNATYASGLQHLFGTGGSPQRWAYNRKGLSYPFQ